MKIKQLSAGRDRSMALTSDGAAFGWGAVKLLGASLPPGYPGELCTTNATEIGHNRYAQPQALEFNPDAPFSSIAEGNVQALAVMRAGNVRAIRPIVSTNQGAAYSVLGDLPAGAIQVAQTESSGFALYVDGSLWSWGMRNSGQLGRPQSSPEHWQAPSRIDGLPPLTSLATGVGHVLALDVRGKVWAWGANSAGQLGLGDLKASMLPVSSKLPTRIKQIAAGDTHSFAVDERGQLWAWGSNNFGQLGDDSSSYLIKPQRIKTDFSIALLDAGMFFSVATSNHGDVFAWGWNGLGQIGQQQLAAFSTPQQIKGLRQVTHLSAGAGHVLAASDSGVHAWGDNRASACGAFPNQAVQVEPQLISFA
jgi:alpha-tubulin suppressor-like RCC1 family protein